VKGKGKHHRRKLVKKKFQERRLSKKRSRGNKRVLSRLKGKLTLDGEVGKRKD